MEKTMPRPVLKSRAVGGMSIALLLALTAAGCDGESSVRISSTRSDDEARGVLRVVESLQCPQTLGPLTRKGSAQAGGTICTYGGPRGAEVSLHLVRLDDETVDGVLAQFESRLRRDMPPSMPTNAAAAPAQTTAPGPEGETATVQAPGVTIQAKGDDATVRLPGMSIVTEGETANVRIGGISIKADDSAGQVEVASGQGSVAFQTQGDGTEVRTRAGGESTRATWILTDDRPSQAGWRLVGYEARGPINGPIVVATVRTKDRDGDPIMDAAKDLVTLNVGE